MRFSVQRAACLLGLIACSEPQPAWYRSLTPDSPCYRVDLSDGLDEHDTAEIQDLFGCLNYHGHLTSFEPTAAKFESATPTGGLVGTRLARASNGMLDSGADLVDLALTASSLVDLPEPALLHVEDLVLELIYGQKALAVRQRSFDLADPATLAAGPLARMRPVIPPVARALGDRPDTIAFAGDVLSSPTTHRWVRTVTSWAASTAPQIRDPLDDLLPEFGRAVVATRSPRNDRWPQASGDSIRDLLRELTVQRSRGDFLEASSPNITTILEDTTFRTALAPKLVELEQQGHLGPTLAQLTWLTQVDAKGTLVRDDATSAFISLVRLMHATNKPLDCTLDIWITVLDVNIGNLAVELLRVLADQDPDDVQSAAGLFGRLLGYGLGDGVLQSIATSGICPVLTPQVVDDLNALERLAEPSARALTHTAIALLKLLKEGDQDLIPVLADVLSDAWVYGIMPPSEEVLRDLGESRAFRRLTELVPAMDRPETFGITAGEDPAATLDDLLQLVGWLFKPDQGETGWQRIRDLALPLLAEDETWDAVHATMGVMGDRGSALSNVHRLLPEALALDPDLKLLRTIATLTDEQTAIALSDALATEAFVDALLASEPEDGPDSSVVPLVFVASLIERGTFTDLLRLMRLITDDLRALGSSSQQP